DSCSNLLRRNKLSYVVGLALVTSILYTWIVFPAPLPLPQTNTDGNAVNYDVPIHDQESKDEVAPNITAVSDGRRCELECVHGSCIDNLCKCNKHYTGNQCEKLYICFVVPQTGFRNPIEVGNKLKMQLEQWKSSDYQIDFKCNDAATAIHPTLL